MSSGSYLEMAAIGAFVRVPLTGGRVTVGRAEENDIVLQDPRVSAVHALLEPVGPHWCIRDLGSRNGTAVNGERILTERVLQPADEIRLGETLLTYRATVAPESPTTEGAAPAPTLTRRERDVVAALCRPLAEGSILTEPASVATIAAELVLTDSAVKKHLANLYDKFGLYDNDRRRGRLANEAIARGAVRIVELRRHG